MSYTYNYKMCLAVPVEVMEVSGNTAKVSSIGEMKTVDSSLISDLKRGDYVLVHGGLAIQKLPAEDARKTIELLNQMIEDSV